MKSQPLTGAEFELLSAILERLGEEHRMNLERLDGFLAALICGPNLVRPSEYFPRILGEDFVFEDTSVLQEFLSFIMRHWNTIVDTLNSGEIFLPLLLEDENGIGHANDWAIGFLHGMGYGKEDWAVLLDDVKRSSLRTRGFRRSSDWRGCQPKYDASIHLEHLPKAPSNIV